MNLQKMLKQAQEMQSKLGNIQAEMEQKIIEVQVGGGAVTLALTGKGHLAKLVIAPEAMDDKETLEDLIMAAHRDAKEKADSMMSDAMGSLTAGLPGGLKLPF